MTESCAETKGEARETAVLAERALSKILDLMTDREEALDLLTAYTKLVRRRAGYDILTHEWDEAGWAAARTPPRWAAACSSTRPR